MQIDYTKKENQNFKSWVTAMWADNYLQLFVVFLLAFILTPLCLGLDYLLLNILWGTVMGVIVYKGFYKRWDELKQGKTS